MVTPLYGLTAWWLRQLYKHMSYSNTQQMSLWKLCENRGLQHWQWTWGASETISLRSGHFLWVLKMSRNVPKWVRWSLLSIFLLSYLFFFYLYIIHKMSGSSDAIAHEFRFFCVFFWFSHCLTYGIVLCVSVSVTIYKMGTNKTYLIKLFWGSKKNNV